jgi:hypothetical protein
MRTTLKLLGLFLLFAPYHSSFGQMNTNLVGTAVLSEQESLARLLGERTNLIASGAWSEQVNDHNRWLRGRLLVYEDPTNLLVTNLLVTNVHLGVYLELEHVLYGWIQPVEVYWNPTGLPFSTYHPSLTLEARDEHGQPIPRTESPVRVFTRGPLQEPCWVTLPCDSTVRLRWSAGIMEPIATDAFFLSGTFTPETNHPSPLNYHVWQGTLKLPPVKVPAKKP